MSSYGDAIMANMIASMDPMHMVVRTMMGQQAKASEVNLDTARTDLMDRLEAKIEELQSKTGDPKVIAAYQRMLDKHSK